jgi:dienelactone hydrolase
MQGEWMGNRGTRKGLNMHKSRWRWLRAFVFLPCIFGMVVTSGHAQVSKPYVEESLAQPSRDVPWREYQLQEFLLKRIPPLPAATTPAAWSAEEERVRQHVLNDIAYHGWPREWVDAAPQFEEVGIIETSHGYRIHKLRFEVVPGFYSTALLYEPAKITGRVPAILNLLGHEPDGIGVEYEQKRCINFAKRGIIALDVEFIGFGELTNPENAHDFASQLNLVGSNALGIFYLSMRRGLDYLNGLPQVDTTRIGVTGLSGGGWQTVMLSALDPRVAVAVEVAGIGSRESNTTHPVDTDEIEEDAPDLMQGEDYPELLALRAPRPTMVIHNATDSCCFRAPMVKPYLYDQVKPFFQLYGMPDNLAWREDLYPGTHNYQLDNRNQAYRFFSAHFKLPILDGEIHSDDEIRTPQELAIGVPADNLTFVTLARKLAQQIHHEAAPADGEARQTWAKAEREKLESVVRYAPVSTVRALRVDNGRAFDFRTLTYRFDFSNELSANGILFREEAAPENAPAVIVLDDKGYKAATDMVAPHVDRGEQVLALDLFFNGDQLPDRGAWELLTDSSGARPLGLEAAQLVAIASWLRFTTGQPVQVETDGIRNQVIALTAAAIAPEDFSAVVNRSGMKSLGYLIDTPVPFRSAPELFCLDLYRYFDIDMLAALAAPGKIVALNSLR